VGPISLASCAVDPELGVVTFAGAQLRLTTKEAALFGYLAARPHQTVSRAELLREVWGFRGRTPNSRAPDFAVLRLRTKVERHPEELPLRAPAP
jgi:DNA-binding response OmpR family regulator